MKNTILSLLLLGSSAAAAQSTLQPANPDNVNQASQRNNYILPIAKMAIKGSHPIGVDTDKTIHIVFPHEIKEVDIGVAEVVSQITPAFTNILKLKAMAEFSETNLTVLTAGGDLFSFILNYQKNPEILNINIEKNYQADAINSKKFNFSTFTKSDFLIPGINISETQIRKNFDFILQQKRRMKNIGVKNLNVGAFVQNIYMDESLLYVSLKLENNSGVTFPIDFVKFYVRDVETAKRQTIQEEELPIVLSQQLDPVYSLHTRSFVVAIPRITISSDKQIDLEIYEAKGGRHLRFPINSKIISNAKTLPKI